MTKYAVLKVVKAVVEDGSSGPETVYVFVARDVDAQSAEGALRKVVKTVGTFAAVPERSWTEKEVAVEQPAPRIVIGGQAAIQQTLTEDPASQPSPPVGAASTGV